MNHPYRTMRSSFHSVITSINSHPVSPKLVLIYSPPVLAFAAWVSLLGIWMLAGR